LQLLAACHDVQQQAKLKTLKTHHDSAHRTRATRARAHASAGRRRPGRMARDNMAARLLLASICARVPVIGGSSPGGSRPALSPQSVPFAFPYLAGSAAIVDGTYHQRDGAVKSYTTHLPKDVVDMLVEDARKLRHDAQAGSFKDEKGSTWWQAKTQPRRCVLEQFIEVIGRLDFPDGIPKGIAGAEYWVQDKPGNQEGGFHYDKDESAASNQQRMIFPSLSTITYLSTGGAPTLILNQTTNQFGNDEVPAIPNEGWLSFPEKGKHTWFNGKAQHVRTAGLLLLLLPTGGDLQMLRHAISHGQPNCQLFNQTHAWCQGVAGSLCQTNCAEDRLVLLVNWWDHTPEPPNCLR
jgi:hypothetical protein